MRTTRITATPAQIMVEQLAASDIRYVFYNSGSREARFFDALHTHPDVHGILALHEGSVAAMAGGYAQVEGAPAVMVVHLGAGLAQCLGQLINLWTGGLPVVVLTFAGDTGSYADRLGLDLSHSSGPTSISRPFVKASWTVVEAEGLPHAIYRALLVARTPPMGPVHLAVYDRVLSAQQVTTDIIEGGIPDTRAGRAADDDVKAVVRALHAAERPLLYVGDGVWKSRAEGQVAAFAEHFGVPVASAWGEMRSVPAKHELHCGHLGAAVAAFDPDCIVCVGVRHGGSGRPHDFGVFNRAEHIIAIGSDVENLTNVPGVDLAILADERRTFELLTDPGFCSDSPKHFDDRRGWAKKQAAVLRMGRAQRARSAKPQPGSVRPWTLATALDDALVLSGGGLVMIEQYAVPFDCFESSQDAAGPAYVRAAGASEGYGVGATIGAKLAAPSEPVIGVIGDGSLYYADSGLWTAAHHAVPVLYVIANNRSYGIVASAFARVDGAMKQSGEYAGVVLDGIDPVKLAEGFGVEGLRVQDESALSGAIARGLELVRTESRPYLLDVRLPLGLPTDGRAAKAFQAADAMEERPST